MGAPYIYDISRLRVKCASTKRQSPGASRNTQDIFRSVRSIAKSEYKRHVCLFVCLSLRMEQLGSDWTNLYEILYLRIFRKSGDTIQVSLKCDNNNGHLTRRRVYIYDNILLDSS